METQVKERLTGAVILVALIVLLVPELLTGGPGGSPPSTTETVSAGEPAVRTYRIDLVRGGVRPQTQAAEPDLTAKSLGKPVGSASVPAEATAPAQPAQDARSPASVEAPDLSATAKPAAPEKAAPEAQEPPSAKPLPVPQAAPSRIAKAEDRKPAPAVSARPAPRPAAQSASTAPGSGWAVQLGSFASRDNAQRLAKQLTGKGFSAFVLGGGGSSGKLYRVRVGPQSDRAAADAAAAKLRSAGFKGGAVVSQP